MNIENDDKEKAYILAAIIIALAVIVWHNCERKLNEFAGDMNVVHKAEPIRQRVTGISKAAHKKALKLAAERLTQIEALQRTIIAETGKRKQAEQKARESANTYAKTPTLDNCDKALRDCQEENETKGYSLAVQERMLSEYDSLNTLQVSEIARQSAVIDTLAEGWQAANAENAKLAKKVQRKNKLLKIVGGIIAVLGGVVAIR